MSSAFCSAQHIANIVSSLVIVPLSFIRHQFITFSNIKIFYQVPILLNFGPEYLSILLLVGLGFRIESVDMYEDVVRPSITPSDCLNSGHCHCGPFTNSVLSCQWLFVSRIEAWCYRVKPGCCNFP
jgi:hypothetical protein